MLEARVCRSVVLFVSPKEVVIGWVVVGVLEMLGEGWDCKREVKIETWARARAEERVDMRSVLLDCEVVSGFDIVVGGDRGGPVEGEGAMTVEGGSFEAI